MRYALVIVALGGCAADETHWDLTQSLQLDPVVLDADRPKARLLVHMAFDGPLTDPDGSLGFTPEIEFLDPGEYTIEFKARLSNQATSEESWISYTYQSWGPGDADDIRTFAWRECDDDCAVDYSLTLYRLEPLDDTSPRTQITGLINTYLTNTGDGDTPPEGAAITMTLEPIY